MMIKAKKRAAENAGGSDEPSKKKTFKVDGKTAGKQRNNTPTDRPAKFDRTKKQFSGKPGFKQQGVNKFANKSGGKPFSNKNEGKPFSKPTNTTPAVPEKTDWAKFKKEKKELKMKRKQSKDLYEISAEGKQIFEKLRCRRTEKKSDLVEKLYNLFTTGEDTFRKLVMAHDTARVIQCMLKFASPALREQISEKLMPLAVDMSISKYSHFCVLRMFKYGSPKTKSKLVDSFLGNIFKLASHVISNRILDHVYLTVASAEQKAFMRQEFYGDLYKKAKDKNVKCIADTYKDSPSLKSSILGAVKLNLEHIVNKNMVDNSLVHAVMLEYLREIDEDKVEETVTLFGPLIPLMLTTKGGAQAAIICFYKSTAKNRRAIIKAIKEHLVKISTHEHGHVFLLAVLNSLDDTKATKKAIYDTIHPELQALMANQWGRRVIEWLAAPADTNCFHPRFITSLDEGLQYGKKDKEVRRKEIFEQIEAPIAAAISEQPDFWISERHIGLVTAEILKNFGAMPFSQAANALAGIIVDPQWTVNVEEETKDKKPKKPVDFEKIVADATKIKKKKQAASKKKVGEIEDADDDANADADSDDDDAKDTEDEEKVNKISVPGIEEAGLHIVLKKIIKNDKARTEGETFGTILLQQLKDETLDYWFTVNRACFVLLNILENNNEDATKTLQQLVKPKLALLKAQSSSGAKLLLKKLAL